MKKRSGYKYHIEQALIKNHWEIVEASAIVGDFWESEYWIVKAIHNPDIDLYFSYNKPWQYELSEVTVSNMNTSEYTRITSLYLSKGGFNSDLKEFITDLNTFRNNIKYQHENNSRS